TAGRGGRPADGCSGLRRRPHRPGLVLCQPSRRDLAPGPARRPEAHHPARLGQRRAGAGVGRRARPHRLRGRFASRCPDRGPRTLRPERRRRLPRRAQAGAEPLGAAGAQEDMTWTAEFLAKPVWLWAIFVTVVIGLLAFDLGVLHRKSREIPLKESLLLSGAYILVAVAFGVWTWATLGSDAGAAFFSGYLL